MHEKDPYVNAREVRLFEHPRTVFIGRPGWLDEPVSVSRRAAHGVRPCGRPGLTGGIDPSEGDRDVGDVGTAARRTPVMKEDDLR
jgi:hypothetical protein